jgi:hypothetical protein
MQPPKIKKGCLADVVYSNQHAVKGDERCISCKATQCSDENSTILQHPVVLCRCKVGASGRLL